MIPLVIVARQELRPPIHSYSSSKSRHYAFMADMTDLPSLEWCLGGYALLTLVCLGAVTLKYRSIFHPLLFVGLQLFVQALVRRVHRVGDADHRLDCDEAPIGHWLSLSC